MIKWFESDEGIPIPVSHGEVHEVLALFMYHMATKPKKSRGKGKRTDYTLNNMKSHLKMWFDFVEDNEDEDGTPWQWDKVTYEEHMEPLREELLHGDDPIEPASYNLYYSTWRTFYEWCADQEIPTLMRFPALRETTRQVNKDNDLLAHTHSNQRTVLVDPGKAPTDEPLDYTGRFLNLEQVAQLIEALDYNDPVYAAIALSMLGTGLRIAGVLQVPKGRCKQNPDWHQWAELIQSKASFQKLRYIPKGQKGIKTCQFPTSTMGLVFEKYIKPNYQERCKLYAQRKKNDGQMPPTSLLWLTSTGKAVERWDIHAAFRKASDKIGFKVTPHFLRHTYATYVVWNYFKAHGMKPNMAAAKDIHHAVKDQLGHADIETTMRYVRTILRVQAEIWLPKLTPSLTEQVDEYMPAMVQEELDAIFSLQGAKHKPST